MIEPYQVMDKYVPNRHGIIFKELIYVFITILFNLIYIYLGS